MTYLRHLPMDGLENARDLGGYATADGGVTKYGVFIRSELPENLSEKDFEILKAYHVVRSLDLRSAFETGTEPSDLADVEGIEYLNLPVFDDAAASGKRTEEKRPDPPKDFTFPDWDVTYIHILEDHKEWVFKVLEAITSADGCVQFNCYTGKDRTGLISAMLLGIAGVSRQDICADYSLSMSYLNRRYRKMAERMPSGKMEEDGRPSVGGGFFATLPTYMEKTLEHLEEHYGGVVPYLKSCNVSDETIAVIRKRFVESRA